MRMILVAACLGLLSDPVAEARAWNYTTPVPPGAYQLMANLSYTPTQPPNCQTTVNGACNLGDLYLPTSTANPPVVMFVHGGGFRPGGAEKGVGTGDCKIMAQNGFACFAINYRLGNASSFVNLCPAPNQDARAALRFLIVNAAALGIKVTKGIGIMGDSAGALLASVTALTQDLSAMP